MSFFGESNRLMSPIAGGQLHGLEKGDREWALNFLYAADTYRVAVSLELDHWSDLGDLQPALGGDFDDTGLGVEFAFHVAVTKLAGGTLLVGGDLGPFTHDSNVRGVFDNEDLQATLLYFGPSAKWRFGRGPTPHYYLEAGVGYHDATVDEYEDDCFWSCDNYEYYDHTSGGGYVGTSAEFDVGDPGDIQVAVGAKVHFVDFDDPVELESPSSLGGPVYQLQVSVAWGY